MEITTKEFKRCIVLQTAGRIDHYSAPQLDKMLQNIIEEGKFKLVLDMTDVEFMSSAGWWVLIKAQKACKRFNRGEVVLVGLKEPIQESMDLVGIGPYFHSFANLLDAVGSI